MLGGEVSADISPKNFNCFVIGLLMMQFRQFLHDESASIVQQEKRHANWDFAPYQIKVCRHRKSDIRLCFFINEINEHTSCKKAWILSRVSFKVLIIVLRGLEDFHFASFVPSLCVIVQSA